MDTEDSLPPTPLRLPPSFEEEFPGARVSASECVINVLRAADLVLEEMTRWLRPDGISPTAGQLLAIVEGAGEPLAPHVIAERLLVTSGSMTSLVDTLERRGLVRRLPHPRDRRKLLIEITDEARRLVDERMPQFHAMERAWLADLTPEEQDALVRALGAVQARIYAMRGQPFPTGQGRRRPADGAPREEEPMA